MAGVEVVAGSELAQAIQAAVQPKLIENGWVSEESDTTLSEYVTMMMVNGKDVQGVASELGGDLLGVGEQDGDVIDFAQWLFQEVQSMAAPAQQQMSAGEPTQDQQSLNQSIPSVQDSSMEDAAVPSDIPSGPKAMRNGGAGRGRDKRMLGQLNNHLNRDQLPDPLRRIKGAAGGQHGRIDSHAGRGPPRGPRGGGAANGVQRMMNGGRGSQAAMAQMNPMLQQQNGMNQLNPQQQMAFMQMMEMQANMMSQIMQNGGQMPGFGQQNGAGQGKSLFDRVDKRSNGHFKGRQRNTENGENSMEVDAEGNKKEPFDTACRFNTHCTNPTCPYAHQSPAAPPGQTMDLTDTCAFGAACENRKCTGRHPSPATRAQHLKQEVDCKFFPNCNNPNCPFKHPDMPLCRNGADCAVPNCKFTHSKIACRYNPCTKPFCPFKHAEGQKGVFKDKVWTSSDGVPNIEGEGENGGKADRFAGFKESEGQAEELILPGQQQQENGAAEHQMQTEVAQASTT
jgi:nuclear polyadenylated RNA-binding protein NAB2